MVKNRYLTDSALLSVNAVKMRENDVWIAVNMKWSGHVLTISAQARRALTGTDNILENLSIQRKLLTGHNAHRKHTMLSTMHSHLAVPHAVIDKLGRALKSR